MDTRYLARMDYGRTHGWWIRLQYANQQKMFSDRKWGGKRKALLAAIRYRNEMRKQFPVPAPRGSHATDKRNNTGTVGVSYQRYRKWSTYGDRVNGPYWIEEYRVTYVKHGRQRIRSFSIKKHGKRNAWRLALKARQEALLA